MQSLHESLEEFPVVITAPLQWGDQDAFGHVNNTIYLRWSESARIEYLLRIGGWREPVVDGVGPILAKICCNFRIPLTYPDTVYIGASVTRIGNTSFRMAHKVVSAAHQKVAADLESTMVLYDYNARKPVPVPASLRAAIEEMERKPLVR